MDKKELEAKIAEVKAKLDADTEHNALVAELHSLEHEYGMIRAEELLPELVKKHINAFFIDLDGDSYTLEVFKNYDDLKYFPNLEYFHAGTSYAETVDLSACKKLKELDLSDCRMLKKIILAKGCKPTIKYPVAYKGEQAKVEYK